MDRYDESSADRNEMSDKSIENRETEPDMDIPKWEPNVKRCYVSERKRPSRRKRSLIAAAAVVLALIIVVAAVCIIITSHRKPLSSSAGQIPAATLTFGKTRNSSSLVSRADGEGTIKISGGYILTDVSAIVQEVLPSVVSVTSRSLVNYYGNYRDYGGYGDIWDFFFGQSKGNRSGYYQESVPEDVPEQKEIESGIGSGTIIAQNSTELLILTSYHVVDKSSSLYVTFTNEASVDGYIKSADEENDIAIVAVPLADIDEDTVKSIKIATICTEDAAVGEGVIVIGNALGYGISVTTGIVSAVNREISVDGRNLTVIQTDAAINSGNSGGCMLNSKGEIIGINEAKVKVSYVEGMSYAIPVAANLDLIQCLLNKEETFEEAEEETETASPYGVFLGIRGRDVDESIQKIYGDIPQGVYVSSVVPGSGAQEGGIIEGDIIVGIEDAVISTMEELQKELNCHRAGDYVKVILLREIGDGYQSMTLDVYLSDWIS